jgi:D-alanyl-lipoteichoic acid acyltransferase DltB (MBOAT superfamily)
MAWKPEFILLIIFSTLVDYLVSIRMGQLKDQKKRKKYLAISLITNLGLLFFFKYLLFVNQTVSHIFDFFNYEYPISETINILLPMGISFYTFQTLSYTIDVYKGKIKPEKHLGVFALYVSFFPQLVAGPIERSERLLPQLYKKHKFDLERIVQGLQLMLIGFFKKVVIADRVAVAVNRIYNQPNEYEGLYFIIATVLFAFQIFCDFSGYSDIAIGAAKVMGIDLMTNFKQPYFATSIRGFWSQWHISLSTWFRDYVYIPLGGSRVKVSRFYLNLFLVFLISGLWHGANWTFVIWGALHGFYQIFGHMTRPFRKKVLSLLYLDRIPRVVGLFQMIITFGLVCFAWIFFRANSLVDANYMVRNLLSDYHLWLDIGYVYEVITNLGVSLLELVVIGISILVLILIEWLSIKAPIYERLARTNFVFRWSFYYIILMLILTMGVYNDAAEFIYFQF